MYMVHVQVQFHFNVCFVLRLCLAFEQNIWSKHNCYGLGQSSDLK